MTTFRSFPPWAAARLLSAATLWLTLAVAGGAAAPALAAGSGWSNASPISPANQPDPTRGSQLNDVAVNASGLTIAAWDQLDYTNGGSASIGAAIQSGGRWGKPFVVSAPGGWSMTPRVAVGDDGTMAVSWTYQDPSTAPSPQQKIQVAVRPAGSAAWTITTLAQHAPGGVQLTLPVPVAVDASGNVTAAWSLWDGTRNLVQAATRLAADGQWTVASLAPTDSALFASLAINERGDAGVVFAVSPYAGYAMTSHLKVAFRSGASGGWSPAVQVSETIPSNVGYVSAPRIALDAQGLATVVYLGNGIEAVRQTAAGSWTAPQTILKAPNPGSSYFAPDLALDQHGQALVATTIFDADTQVQRASTWVLQGSADGSWSVPLRLTDPTVPVDAYAARAALSRDGTLALVGWIDHYHGTVQVARWMGSAWKTTTIGRGTAFSAFQEVLGLSAGSATSARAIWKNTKSGTQTMASSYGN